MTSSMFDDFVLKAKDVVDAAGKQTNKLYEVSKYRYACAKVNGEIRKLYEELGNAVYSMVKGGYDNDDLVESLTQEIDEKLEELRQLNNKIADLKNNVVCPICGASNMQNSIYCAKCGAKINDEFHDDSEGIDGMDDSEDEPVDAKVVEDVIKSQEKKTDDTDKSGK